MRVELWQLIEGWLRESRWDILSVIPPNVDKNGDILPAFIVAYEKPVAGILHHSEDVVVDPRPNPQKPRELLVMIKDNEVLFNSGGIYAHPLKASEPDFFEKFEVILTTLFHQCEWWQIKAGWVVNGNKKKIWPRDEQSPSVGTRP